MIFIYVISTIAINACGLCVLMHKWDEQKEKQEKSLIEFKDKIFEHVRSELQATSIENEELRNDFKKFKDDVLK